MVFFVSSSFLLLLLLYMAVVNAFNCGLSCLYVAKAYKVVVGSIIVIIINVIAVSMNETYVCRNDIIFFLICFSFRCFYYIFFCEFLCDFETCFIQFRLAAFPSQKIKFQFNELCDKYASLWWLMIAHVAYHLTQGLLPALVIDVVLEKFSHDSNRLLRKDYMYSCNVDSIPWLRHVNWQVTQSHSPFQVRLTPAITVPLSEFDHRSICKKMVWVLHL